jgi:hypothetical protein
MSTHLPGVVMILHLIYPTEVAAVDRYVQRCFGMPERSSTRSLSGTSC